MEKKKKGEGVRGETETGEGERKGKEGLRRRRRRRRRRTTSRGVVPSSRKSFKKEVVLKSEVQ